MYLRKPLWSPKLLYLGPHKNPPHRDEPAISRSRLYWQFHHSNPLPRLNIQQIEDLDKTSEIEDIDKTSEISSTIDSDLKHRPNEFN